MCATLGLSNTCTWTSIPYACPIHVHGRRSVQVRIVEMLETLIHDPMHHFAGKGSTTAGSKTEAAVYEVEKAIDRVGILLQLGLGEAGAKIISQSMQVRGRSVRGG